MEPPPEPVASFFESYVGAFERSDADDLLGYFDYPLAVAGENGTVEVRCVDSREGWLPTVTMLLDLYGGFGVATAEMTSVHVARLSDRLFSVAVSWRLETAAGEPVYAFDAAYTLADRGDGLKVVAIAHNELPRIMEKLGG